MIEIFRAGPSEGRRTTDRGVRFNRRLHTEKLATGVPRTWVRFPPPPPIRPRIVWRFGAELWFGSRTPQKPSASLRLADRGTRRAARALSAYYSLAELPKVL